MTTDPLVQAAAEALRGEAQSLGLPPPPSDMTNVVGVVVAAVVPLLRAQIAAEIERHCLNDAFLDPDDPENGSKVCRYCYAAARIAEGTA